MLLMKGNVTKKGAEVERLWVKEKNQRDLLGE